MEREPLTILAIDDDVEDAEILGFHLEDIEEWDVTFLHVGDPNEAAGMFAVHQVDVTFLDYQLGAQSGLEVLNDIRTAGHLGPVIVVTGQGDEYVAANLTRAGADDYIVKSDITTSVLRRSVEHARVKARQREAERTMHEQACVLAEINKELEQSKSVIESRARELEAANKKLNELNELKTKFLSEVSHELRTPLTSIVSSAKIIKKYQQTKPESVVHFAETILHEGNRLTRMLNDFLDLAKIESGCASWKDTPITCDELLSQAVSGIESLAIDGGIKVSCNVEHGSEFQADFDRLTQVITNLLSNAIKHTPPGGTITVTAEDSPDSILFTVRDTGVGIPAEECEKVFAKFYQSSAVSAVDSRYKGTGLGLCICVEIVQHYGGRIWVESELGKGTAFKFTLAHDRIGCREACKHPEHGQLH